MKALTDHPDQRDLWYGDFEAHARTAVEEIVRWATPVIHFRRTATDDTELSGQPIAAGDKVVLWYNSANRDERVFADPYRFDVTRPLQPAQVGFGAGGPHFCLGANLARREITVMFDELRRRVPDLQHHRRAGLPRELLHQRDQAAALRLGLSGRPDRRGQRVLAAAAGPRPEAHVLADALGDDDLLLARGQVGAGANSSPP